VRATRGADGVRWASFTSSAGSLKVRVIFPLDASAPLPQVGETWECAGWLERTKVDDISLRRKLEIMPLFSLLQRFREAVGVSYMQYEQKDVLAYI
jgi:hypothetical protein